MDVELGSVITAISKNKSLKHLIMGRNIVNMKTKHVTTIMEALVQTIQVCAETLREIVSSLISNEESLSL